MHTVLKFINYVMASTYNAIALHSSNMCSNWNHDCVKFQKKVIWDSFSGRTHQFKMNCFKVWNSSWALKKTTSKPKHNSEQTSLLKIKVCFARDANHWVIFLSLPQPTSCSTVFSPHSWGVTEQQGGQMACSPSTHHSLLNGKKFWACVMYHIPSSWDDFNLWDNFKPRFSVWSW